MRSIYLCALIAAIAPTHGCALAALHAVEGEMMAAMPERGGVNAWRDADSVRDNCREALAEDGWGDMKPSAMAAPAWSYGGMAIRMTALYGDGRSASAELEARAWTVSGLNIEVFVDGTRLESPGESAWSWQRFALSPEHEQRLRTQGLELTVRADVGEWRFRLPPSYAEGLTARLDSINRHWVD